MRHLLLVSAFILLLVAEVGAPRGYAGAASSAFLDSIAARRAAREAASPPRFGVLRGRVSVDGKPAAGAILRMMGTHPLEVRPAALAHTPGTFTMPNVPVGQQRFMVEYGYVYIHYFTVAVDSGPNPWLELRLDTRDDRREAQWRPECGAKSYGVERRAPAIDAIAPADTTGWNWIGSCRFELKLPGDFDVIPDSALASRADSGGFTDGRLVVVYSHGKKVKMPKASPACSVHQECVRGLPLTIVLRPDPDLAGGQIAAYYSTKKLYMESRGSNPAELAELLTAFRTARFNVSRTRISRRTIEY